MFKVLETPEVFFMFVRDRMRSTYPKLKKPDSLNNLSLKSHILRKKILTLGK